MHELAITESLLDIALTEARKANASRITAIRLKIGEMTGIVPESVTFYLGMLAKGTPAEGVRLEITALPVTANCPACGTTFPVADLIFLCPDCGGPGQVVTGRELMIESLDVE